MKPPEEAPAQEPARGSALREWEQQCTTTCANHATCSLLGALGPQAVHPFIAPIVELHDEMTRVETGLALA